ncbi:hypothetical protein VTK73DRAFT_1576 [Phialemonium thermophilum]|uniref:Uncharacterized protein n=1 Tax=Phialemonium thermophilum TaxID=223376 RepID=A0ABR3VTA5_9PEZI
MALLCLSVGEHSPLCRPSSLWPPQSLLDSPSSSLTLSACVEDAFIRSFVRLVSFLLFSRSFTAGPWPYFPSFSLPSYFHFLLRLSNILLSLPSLVTHPCCATPLSLPLRNPETSKHSRPSCSRVPGLCVLPWGPLFVITGLIELLRPGDRPSSSTLSHQRLRPRPGSSTIAEELRSLGA